jgi:preprotein translocase subunit SecG
MNGQDLELFKKTKDRGLIKWLQTIMYIDLLIVLILIVVEFAIKK